MLKPLRIFPILGLLYCLEAISDDKIAIGYGYFSLSATASNTTTTISNPSAFNFSYMKQISNRFELEASYSILLSDFAGSDMGYGINLGTNYYFLTSARDKNVKIGDYSLESYELWRPYVGVMFSQRNFQSVRNSYAGMGVSLGTERYLSKNVNYYGELSVVSLGGTGQSKAQEIQLIFGLVLKKW